MIGFWLTVTEAMVSSSHGRLLKLSLTYFGSGGGGDGIRG